MKPEHKDQIRRANQPGPPTAASPPGQPMQPPMKRPHQQLHIPLVAVTNSPKDEADRGATESMVNQCLREGVYYCPRCDFTTTSPEFMVNHLAEEINKSLAKLNEIGASDAEK